MNQPQLAAVAAATQTREAPQPASDFDRLLQQTFSPREILEGATLDKMYQVADSLANSRISVPEHLRGNVGDCLAIVTQAMLWNMNPFAVAQKTHIVSGRLGFEAQLVNAVLQNSGAIRGLPRYEYRGEGNALECRVGCVPRGEAEILWGEWLSIGMVTTKNSPLWKVNPRQQMGYLQVKNWARAFAPGAILGVYTVDELEDFAPAPRAAAPAQAASAQPTLPTYPDADFAKNLPLWRGIVESGRKTAADLLATLSTKATFTEAQKTQITQLGSPAPAAAPAEQLSDEHADFVAAMDDAEGGTE